MAGKVNKHRTDSWFYGICSSREMMLMCEMQRRHKTPLFTLDGGWGDPTSPDAWTHCWNWLNMLLKEFWTEPFWSRKKKKKDQLPFYYFSFLFTSELPGSVQGQSQTCQNTMGKVALTVFLAHQKVSWESQFPWDFGSNSVDPRKLRAVQIKFR